MLRTCHGPQLAFPAAAYLLARRKWGIDSAKLIPRRSLSRGCPCHTGARGVGGILNWGRIILMRICTKCLAGVGLARSLWRPGIKRTHEGSGSSGAISFPPPPPRPCSGISAPRPWGCRFLQPSHRPTKATPGPATPKGFQSNRCLVGRSRLFRIAGQAPDPLPCVPPPGAGPLLLAGASLPLAADSGLAPAHMHGWALGS